MNGTWKKWWGIPLALAVAEVISYAFGMWLIGFLQGRHPELMGSLAGAEQFSDLVGRYRLVFSVVFLLVIGLVLRRFFDRGTLLRSAVVTAGVLAVLEVLSRLFPGWPMWLGLAWGPLTDVSSSLALWLGRGSATLLTVLSYLFRFASPFLFVLFGKKEL